MNDEQKDLKSSRPISQKSVKSFDETLIVKSRIQTPVSQSSLPIEISSKAKNVLKNVDNHQ